MPTVTRQTIDWKPFSQKHKAYIKGALRNKMNVAEGAIRSGKTIDHCIIAAMYLEECPDKIHLASGSTIGNAKLNIGACNGFGLENLFRGRCKWGKYKDNEALYLYTQTGEKIVIFAGGAKADSYKRILGNSYGMWIATEINEHYDSEDSRTSFIKVAFGRQVAAEKPLILWDLNPCNPGHSIYKNYIDRYKTTYKGGYQYEHFTIADNLAISPQRLEEIKSQYVPGSVWYRRDIDGERCIAEGLVYPMYEKAMCAYPQGDPKPQGYCLAIDYGTMNAFAALLFAKIGNTWYAIREYYYSGREKGIQKTDEQYAQDLDVWLMDITPDQRIETIIDPSAASFIALLRRRNHRYKVLKADNDVLDGIRETANALDNGYVKIVMDCKNWQEEAAGYVWDKDCLDEDRPVKENDHLMDAMRYFVKTKRIIRKSTRKE
ncbi:MAG: PBSX family phage terminase large subunit [Schwartzia succinivorans]|nr:PBSX family phage terminase large subunit [Schwartzia succinivorans]